MIKEDKELLLKDLCARLPYGVFCSIGLDYPLPLQRLFVDKLDGVLLDFYENGKDYQVYLSEAKPYLRPMSSMTRQECTQLSVLLPRYFMVYPDRLACLEHLNGGIINLEVLDTIIDFYNSHHLDWRGLIDKGLALEAPKDMYKI